MQIACAGWAVGSAYTRRHVMPADVLGAAAMQMLFGGVFMLIAGTLLGEWGRLAFNTARRWAFVYLTLAGSVVAFAAYSYALRHLDVAIVSLYTYINPVIAVALGASCSASRRLEDVRGSRADRARRDCGGARRLTAKVTGQSGHVKPRPDQ